jgi:hypothetical protein
MRGVARIPLAQAEQYAQQFLRLIEAACERIEVAGSVRRRAAHIGEIEILAVPKRLQQANLFGDDLPPRDLLVETVDRLLARDRIRHRPSERGRKVWTPTHREMLFRADRGALVPIDLWWTEPERWGLQLALRTGPAALAYAMTTHQGAVTTTGRAGLLPSDLRVRDDLDQYVGDDEQGVPIWEHVATPEEWDFLRYLYAAPVAPEQRR